MVNSQGALLNDDAAHSSPGREVHIAERFWDTHV